jgi:hypothetical protein
MQVLIAPTFSHRHGTAIISLRIRRIILLVYSGSRQFTASFYMIGFEISASNHRLRGPPTFMSLQWLLRYIRPTISCHKFVYAFLARRPDHFRAVLYVKPEYYEHKVFNACCMHFPRAVLRLDIAVLKLIPLLTV